MSIFSLLILMACSSKETSPIKKLIAVDSLNIELGMPTLIKATNNQLFVNNSFTGTYFIDVIDLKGDSIQYSFATRGQGPHEFLQITSLDIYPDNDKWYIQLFDNLQRKVVIYSIDSLNYYQGKCIPMMEMKAPVDSRFLEIYKLSKGYIATGRTEKKFTFLDDSLSIQNMYGDYLTRKNNNDDFTILSKANYGRLSLDENRTHLLSVIFMSGIISQYTILENEISKEWDYIYSDFDYTLKGDMIIQQSPTGYLAANFWDKDILALYSGEKKQKSTNFAKEFHRFDANGKLIGKYAVDSKLFNFCVLPNTNFIYAISYESDPKILLFELD